MKKVNFRKVVIKNFLSVGETPVVVEFNKGFHVITGKNIDKSDRRNAVGKSTVADAIYFAIFGDTLRGIKKDLIPNNVTGGKTIVELHFDVELPSGTKHYVIERTLGPTKVFIYEDGVDKTRDSISNTTKYICSVIGATPAIFKNCVIMTINDAVPFMSKGKNDKRKFIEDIFGLEIFSVMISEIRKEYNEIKNEFDIQRINLTEATNSYNAYVDQRDAILKRREEKKSLYNERKDSNTKQREALIAEIDLIEDVDSEQLNSILAKYELAIDRCDDKITDLTSDIAVKRTSAIQLKDNYKKIGTSEAKCPTCLRLIEDHDAECIDKEKKQLNAEILEIVNDMKQIKELVNKLTTKKASIKTNIAKVNKQLQDNAATKQTKNSKIKQLRQLEKWLKELEADLLAVEDKDTELDAIIESTNETIAKLTADNANIRKKLSKLDIVKYIVSEEGVKSYIVSKLLEVLNSRLIHYLKQLDSNSICIFNEYFEEEMLNEKNKVCSYFSFSGAERKAIDLACLFTFSDLRRMQGEVKYNLSIYDELFDSSFDERGIELVVDILNERVDQLDECVLLISHRKESIKRVTGDVIYLEKQGGITTRKDYIEM